jgi:hypothetical protein
MAARCSLAPHQRQPRPIPQNRLDTSTLTPALQAPHHACEAAASCRSNTLPPSCTLLGFETVHGTGDSWPVPVQNVGIDLGYRQRQTMSTVPPLLLVLDACGMCGRRSHLTVSLGWPMLAALIAIAPGFALSLWHDAPLGSMRTPRRRDIYHECWT